MGAALVALGFALLAAGGPQAQAQVVTSLPDSAGNVVALTFDGCETPGHPATLDQGIVAVLERENLPFTIFATGLFAETNRDALARLAASPLVEIENHSFSHPMHMQRLDGPAIDREVDRADRIIAGITGRTPRYFRFPAGNYDAASLARVEADGHRVVHWTFASGDPMRGLSPEKLEQWVLYKTRPGSILIFHINGRAPETAQALPRIIAALKARGYGFVRLDRGLAR